MFYIAITLYIFVTLITAWNFKSSLVNVLILIYCLVNKHGKSDYCMFLLEY